LPFKTMYTEGLTSGNDAILVWTYLDFKKRFKPTHYLTPLRKKGTLEGIIAIDPYSGELLWYTLYMAPQAKEHYSKIFHKHSNRKAYLTQKLKKLDSRKFNKDNIHAVSINSHIYYMVPSKKPESIYSYKALDLISDKVHDMRYPLTRNARPGMIDFHDEKNATLSIEKRVEKFSQQKRKSSSGGIITYPPYQDINFESPNAENRWETRMVGQVPLFFQQTDTYSCWAYSLSMVHQWWTPFYLGHPNMQAEMVRHYAKKSDQNRAEEQQVRDLMKNWPKILEKWEKREDVDPNDFPYEYEDFDTVWMGSGKSFLPGLGPSGERNDPKTWIMLEAPVIASVDTDGGGSEAHMDHYVVVVGYNPDHQIVYVNDPHGYLRAFSYWGWSTWWDAHWSWELCGDCLWFYKWNRRGMVVGMPGDPIKNNPPMPNPHYRQVTNNSFDRIRMDFDTPLSDWEKETDICNHVDNYDNFYLPYCDINIPHVTLAGEINTGNWDTWWSSEDKGELDVDDNCRLTPNAFQSDADGDGNGNACDRCDLFDDNIDADNDWIPDRCDFCPNKYNFLYENIDTDGDGMGDPCDMDDDNDGVADNSDNCPKDYNPDQTLGNTIMIGGKTIFIPTACAGAYQTITMSLYGISMTREFGKGQRIPPVMQDIGTGPVSQRENPGFMILGQTNPNNLNKIMNEAGIKDRALGQYKSYFLHLESESSYKFLNE